MANEANHRLARMLSRGEPMDLVLGIGRSGIPLAMTIHDHQQPRGRIDYINIQTFPTGSETPSGNFIRDNTDEVLDWYGNEVQRVIICDGIIDSGFTMEHVIVRVRHKFPKAKIFAAAQYMNPGAKLPHHEISGLYADHDTGDSLWLIQPYEKEYYEF